MQTPPSPHAFESVRELVEAFDGQAWLISKAGPNVQYKTKEWLKCWNFFDQTLLPRKNLRFCLRRPDKAGHCKQLKITHFVDDRLDVLEHLNGRVEHLYLFGEQPNLKTSPDWVTPVIDWPQTVSRVLGTFK